jgi:ClpP class serine protease
LTTESGVADVRAELDELHQLFAEAIAQGRGVTTDAVNANFGRGGVFLADTALRLGMIDSIAPQTTITSEPETSMDLQTLTTQHPEVLAAAKALGAAEERDRAMAHLTLGKASGDLETALAAVESGEGLTALIQAKYQAAAMNRGDQAARHGDNVGLTAADTPAAGLEEPAEQVCALVESQLGIK